MAKTIKSLDLFAGAGGFSLAAERLGIKVLGAIEYDKHACNTYKHNFSGDSKYHKLFEGDICKYTPVEIMKTLKLKKGELDLIMGGPPCQGFSTHRIKNSGVNDPRNKLLWRYFDFIHDFRPKAFVVENVRGMLWDRHKEYVETFYKLAKDNGYKVHDPVILDAKNYGVPQNRQRVFILGIRDDVDINPVWPPEPTHSKPGCEKLPDWIPSGTVFNENLRDDDPNNVHMIPGEEMIERFKETPPNGGSRTSWKTPLDCHKNGYRGHKDVYGRIDPSKPSNTITTGCTNPSKGRFVHPTEHHGITARHCARLQTFPDNFKFLGGLGHMGKQIGNAVPIKLGEAVLNTIKTEIEKNT